MNLIQVSWCSICIASGYLTAWDLAISIVPSHVAAARLLGAAAGLIASYIIPRLLVRQLIETSSSALRNREVLGPQREVLAPGVGISVPATPECTR